MLSEAELGKKRVQYSPVRIFIAIYCLALTQT